MTKILLPLLLFISNLAYADDLPDAGVNQHNIVSKEVDKSMAAISSLELAVLEEFNKTPLRSKIIKIRIKRGKKKTKVYLTWHPVKTKDIAKDTFIIINVITTIIPNFYSISLKAIHPKYMRWSGYIFWGATIVKNAIHINNFIDHQAQPLYQ